MATEYGYKFIKSNHKLNHLTANYIKPADGIPFNVDANKAITLQHFLCCPPRGFIDITNRLVIEFNNTKKKLLEDQIQYTNNFIDTYSRTPDPEPNFLKDYFSNETRMISWITDVINKYNSRIIPKFSDFTLVMNKKNESEISYIQVTIKCITLAVMVDYICPSITIYKHG